MQFKITDLNGSLINENIYTCVYFHLKKIEIKAQRG